MSHHSSEPPFIQKPLGDELKQALSETMGKLMGEYPNGRMNPQDAGAVAVGIGVEAGRVIMRFPKPVAWVGFTGDEALEIAATLIKHARHAGVTSPLVIRLGSDA
jgi:hypothetical protein